MSNQEVLKTMILGMAPQFKAALPKHVDVEKFTRVVLTAILKNPDLANTERASFFSACLSAAQDGLLPDSKEAVITMFNDKKSGTKKAQYMPMINGILKKIRNSGELASITAQLVFQKDSFKWWVDSDGEHLEHSPDVFAQDRGDVIGVYALAKTKDGSVYIEVMGAAEINSVRNASKSKDYGPWSGEFEFEMWKKTAIRRLSKRLPMSTDVEQVITRDDEHYDLKIEPPKEQVKIAEPKKVEKDKPNKLLKMIESEEIKEDAPAKEESPI